MFRNAILVFFFLCANSLAYDLVVVVTAGLNPLGVYYPGGKLVEKHDVFNVTKPEKLITVLERGASLNERVFFDNILIFRSSDLKTRMMIKFEHAPNEKVNKYKLSFYNLAYGDRGGEKPVELKHSNSGYIWIEGGHHVTHWTSENHPFTFYDVNKKIVYSVKVRPPSKEEL